MVILWVRLVRLRFTAGAADKVFSTNVISIS